MNLKKANIIKNINELARLAQKKTAALVLLAALALISIGFVAVHGKAPAKKDVIKQTVKIDGSLDSQFTQEASQKALEEQQKEIKELHGLISDISTKMDDVQNVLDAKSTDDVSDGKPTVEELQARIGELENTLNKNTEGKLAEQNLNDINSRGIATTNFSYEEQNTQAKTAKDYVPPGTFAKAVFLNGADTNAGVHGQTDTTPITLRLLDNGTLPNGQNSSLKGCFVTAAAYGDASSERGQIRLQRLSCIKPSGYILDAPVEGTINDMGGSDGIRGHVVMRNNKLIWNAGVAGVLSGIGSSMQQSLTTQSVSPLGATSMIQPNKTLQYGAFGGANTALGKLADYYIKLADMYHPIVQIHAGSQVNIVFLKGFSLSEGESTLAEKTKSTSSPQEVTQNLMQNIKDAHVGQAVDANDINSGEIK